MAKTVEKIVNQYPARLERPGAAGASWITDTDWIEVGDQTTLDKSLTKKLSELELNFTDGFNKSGNDISLDNDAVLGLLSEGSGISISGGTISVDNDTIKDLAKNAISSGSGISISNGSISVNTTWLDSTLASKGYVTPDSVTTYSSGTGIDVNSSNGKISLDSFTQTLINRYAASLYAQSLSASPTSVDAYDGSAITLTYTVKSDGTSKVITSVEYGTSSTSISTAMSLDTAKTKATKTTSSINAATTFYAQAVVDGLTLPVTSKAVSVTRKTYIGCTAVKGSGFDFGTITTSNIGTLAGKLTAYDDGASKNHAAAGNGTDPIWFVTPFTVNTATAGNQDNAIQNVTKNAPCAIFVAKVSYRGTDYYVYRSEGAAPTSSDTYKF